MGSKQGVPSVYFPKSYAARPPLLIQDLIEGSKVVKLAFASVRSLAKHLAEMSKHKNFSCCSKERNKQEISV